MKNKLYLLLLSSVLLSCASHHTPSSSTPTGFIPPNTTTAFVDQNGDFYPPNWEETYGTPPKIGAYSLRTIEANNSLPPVLKEFENTFLADLKERLESKERVFILVHGYNNDEEKANNNFKKVKNLISSKPATDEFIEFYWDGLVSSNPAGSGKIWFNAAGYSQLAGEFGLRDILNLMKNKEIFLISHSRGASVVLSSLSSPPYNEKFLKDTEKYHELTIQDLTPLKEQGNNIVAIMLAPAVGNVDFLNPDKTEFRSFSSQVEAIHISINENDPILKKFYKPFSSRFNPTDLGYNSNVYKTLKQEIPVLQETNFSGMKSHDFSNYIKHPKFAEMLQLYGIAINQ